MAVVHTLQGPPPQPPAKRVSEHARLCALARRWLLRPGSAGGHGCAIAVTEGWGEGAAEIVDAIGWRRACVDRGAIVVEVKTSRADFLADARKPHRSDPSKGVGRFRYYLCPEGLIAPEELPNRWGLLYVTSRDVIRAVAGPAATLRKHAGALEVDGVLLRGWDAWQRACADFAFEQRNHELEASMLVGLLQRVSDHEAANLRLRELRGQVAWLSRELQAARAGVDRLRWDLMAARSALEDAGLPIPDIHATPTATPRTLP